MIDLPGTVCTKKDLSILGGTLKANMLPKLFSILPDTMPWAICEYTNRYQFLKNDIPELKYLERVRKFGPGGDLEVRSDENDDFRWRYIGPAGFTLLEFTSLDFWNNTGTPHLCFREEKLILWGTRDQNGIFKENRVAAAKLDYPEPVPCGGRLIIKARLYTYYGRPQFAWYYAVEESEA